ncbi:retrovirus-related pol polyprotein from transposon TNT 1-94 [Tanacetum coccineum]
MADLNAEYHERALLANHKRFYKRFRRVGSSRKPIEKSKETCFACGRSGHFQKDCPSNKTSTSSYPFSNNSFSKPKPYTPSFNQTSSQNTGSHQKDYKGKYKGLKIEMVFLTKRIDDLTKGKNEKGKNEKEKSEKGLIAESFDWDEESVSSEDEGTPGLGHLWQLLRMSHLLERLMQNLTNEPLPPLPKLIGATPTGTSDSLISLSDLTLKMADLTLETSVPKKTRPTSVKVSPRYVIKRKTENKSPVISKSCTDKKADSSTEQLLLTLMKEDYLKRYSKESGPKVVFGDDFLGDTEGYDSVNCNGITFTKVAYVNGLKHNLINITQLCDANFKFQFTKTQGTIFNQNDEVVLIAPRRRDVYVIDMSSFNKESNACFFAKASPSVN